MSRTFVIDGVTFTGSSALEDQLRALHAAASVPAATPEPEPDVAPSMPTPSEVLSQPEPPKKRGWLKKS